MKQSTFILSLAFILIISACQKNNSPAPVKPAPANPAHAKPKPVVNTGHVYTNQLPITSYLYTDTFIGISHYNLYNRWPPVDTIISAMAFVIHMLKANSTDEERDFSAKLSSYNYCFNMSGTYYSAIILCPINFVFDYNASGTYRKLSASGMYCSDSFFLRNDSLILGGSTSSPGMGCASGCLNAYNFQGRKK